MARTTATRRDSYTVPTIVPAAGQNELRASDLVPVQRTWNDWHTAMVRLDDLDNVHWCWPTGAPRALIHAYVACSRLACGELPHDCEPTSTPHRLLVCLLKSHVSRHVFEYLSQRAVGSVPAGRTG
jgi:hypothetical protein